MTKNKIYILVIVGVILIIFGCVYREKLRLTNNDFRVGIVSQNGIVIKSISKDRNMINTLQVGSEVPVWIPRGMGWYNAGKIAKLLGQENKPELLSEVLFYNFGFVPDVVLTNQNANLFFNWQVCQKWGWLNYLGFWITSGQMMVKEEEYNQNIDDLTVYMGKVASRDFADNRLLREDLRISIFNASGLSGMASFIARNLQWSGLTVVGIDNYPDSIAKCKIVFGTKAASSYGFEMLKNRFPECENSQNDKLGEMEVELYFGDSFAQMLNYQSYIQIKN